MIPMSVGTEPGQVDIALLAYLKANTQGELQQSISTLLQAREEEEAKKSPSKSMEIQFGIGINLTYVSIYVFF